MACDPDKLAKTIGGRGRLLIVTHDNPDPDALVTAAALARFARFGFRKTTLGEDYEHDALLG